MNELVRTLAYVLVIIVLIAAIFVVLNRLF